MAVLNFPLKEQIENIINKSNAEYDKGNYIDSIKLLEEAWDRLPEPKGIYDESFHIAKYTSETYLLIKDGNNAKVWSERLFQCDLERIDSGERDFLAGKVVFELGDFEVAKKYFTIANAKSEGRCFEDEDKKYIKFFRK